MPTVVSWKRSLGMMAFGMPFLVSGGCLLLAGLGILPIDKSHLTVPLWVLCPIGLVFAVPGGLCVSAGLGTLARGGVLAEPSPPAIGLAVAVVLSCMAVGFVATAILGDSGGS